MAKFCIHCGKPMVGKLVRPDYGIGKLPASALLADRYEIIGKIADGIPYTRTFSDSVRADQ